MTSLPDDQLKSAYVGKSILITGGTGTLGHALAARLLQYEPRVIRLFSRDEYKQYVLKQQWGNLSNVRFLLGDVRDYDRVSRAVEGVDIVLHTAALKHVPACEYNPFEAVQTNVLGTQNVIVACQRNGVRHMLFTSSDKAISPPNTMGATKLLAERIMIAASHARGSANTKLCAVRFGNVLGSRGSAVNQFVIDVRAGRPVQVTDMDMTRFIMTLDEAVTLVLKSLMLAQGGDVFVLKMPVVRLGDLVQVIVEQHTDGTFDPQGSQIQIIGPRRGEKLFEELLNEEEAKRALEWEDLFVLPPWWDEDPHYSGAVAATRGVYSSRELPLMSIDEIRHMLSHSPLPVPAGDNFQNLSDLHLQVPD